MSRFSYYIRILQEEGLVVSQGESTEKDLSGIDTLEEQADGDFEESFVIDESRVDPPEAKDSFKSVPYFPRGAYRPVVV